MVEELIIKVQQLFARSMLTFIAFVGCIFVATVLAQMAYTPPGMYRDSASLNTSHVYEIAITPEAKPVKAF